MRTRLTFVAFAIGLLTAAAFGQPASQQAPTLPQQPPIFRAGTNVVRVDVTVTDQSGRPVTTLTADDFEISEDGRPQSITTFKLVEATGQPTDEVSLPIRSPEHAAVEAARDDVRVFLVFWDEYHIGQFASAIRAREHLTRFVLDAFGPTDLVALMDPLTTLSAVRFTRDRRALADAIHQLKGRQGVYLPPRSVIEEAHLYEPRRIEDFRSQVTTSALKAAIMHLGSLREGRKALIVVSEHLGRSSFEAVPDLIRTANDNNTAVYAIDPRGLQVQGAPPSTWLQSLAVDTGGEWYARNDIAGALRRVVTQASAFYLVGYTPVDSPMDGKFHTIKVRMKRPGLEVHARNGYRAMRPGEMARTREATAAAALPPNIARALERLTPVASHRSVDLWTGTAPGPGGRAAITLAWAARAGSDEAAASVDVEATMNGTAAYTGRLDPNGVTFDAMPGTLTLIATVRNAAGESIDRERRSIEVPKTEGVELALSTPVVSRARTAFELRALSAAAPPVFAGREFGRADRMRVRVAAYGSAAAGAPVSAALLSSRGAKLVNLPIEAKRGGPPNKMLYEIDLPLLSVGSGDYLIRIEAGTGDARVEALVPFRVLR